MFRYTSPGRMDVRKKLIHQSGTVDYDLVVHNVALSKNADQNQHVASWLPNRLLEDRINRKTLFFQDGTQPFKCIHLNLSHPLPGHTQLISHLFQG